MDAKSQRKVINAGFIIIREGNYPSPRIKFKDKYHYDWVTLESFATKAERDIRMRSMLEEQILITD